MQQTLTELIKLQQERTNIIKEKEELNIARMKELKETIKTNYNLKSSTLIVDDYKGIIRIDISGSCVADGSVVIHFNTETNKVVKIIAEKPKFIEVAYKIKQDLEAE